MARYFTVILSTIVLLLGSLNVSSVSATSSKEYNNSKFEQITGKVYLDIPMKNWSEKADQVKTEDAELKIKNLNIKNRNFVLIGTVEYGGKSVKFQKSGKIYNSTQNNHDYIIDFNEGRGLSKGLSLVHSAILKNAGKKQLQVNKDLEGKDVIKLAFFEQDDKDLIIFEKLITDFDHELVNKLDELGVTEKVKTVSWAHRVVEVSDVKFTEREEETQMGILSKTAEDTHNYTVTHTYDFGWGKAYHYIDMRAWASMNYPDPTLFPESTLKVEKKYVYGADGSYDEGWSNITAGEYDDPVENFVEMMAYEAAAPDWISSIKWDIDGHEKSFGYSGSLGFSVTKGLLSGGFAKTVNYTISKSKFKSVYEADGYYPYRHEEAFENTKLKDEGNYYIIEHKINHNENTGTEDKIMFIGWIVPFYEKTTNEITDIKPSSLYLYYHSE
ncbi:hypothetical protein ACLIA0_15155 [Bacillaceae bacterium W0354]